MHLTSRDELALPKDLLEKPITVCSLFGVNHTGQECNTWTGPKFKLAF